MKYLLSIGIIIFLLIGMYVLKPELFFSFFSQSLQNKNAVHIKGIAVLGDSQSDEYQADDKRGGEHILNWVEILTKYRNLNFGQWGARDEPRRSGYEYNWARSAATTSSMITSGQHLGVAQQVKDGKVDLVIMYIGANDFAPYVSNGYDAIYNKKVSNHALGDKIDTTVRNIETAIDTIQASGSAKILLVTIPDWNKQFFIDSFYPDAMKRLEVSDAIKQANDKIVHLAKKKDVLLFDVNQFYAETIGDVNTVVATIGTIKLDRAVPSDNPSSELLSDGIHPGTILNGLFAREVIKHLNSQVHTDIKELTDEEIKAVAGMK